MSCRQQIALRAPTAAIATGVPSTSRRRPLWRACADRHNQPWWFSSRTNNGDPGRFDLMAPRGTSYWTLSAAAAIIEATYDPDQIDPPVLTVAALERLSVWLAVDVAIARSKLADATQASGPSLTGEIGAIVPYTVPWAWADAFDREGRHGIVFRSRLAFDECVALFGPAGIPVDPPPATGGRAIAHYDELPAGVKAAISTVGELDQFERGRQP